MVVAVDISSPAVPVRSSLPEPPRMTTTSLAGVRTGSACRSPRRRRSVTSVVRLRKLNSVPTLLDVVVGDGEPVGVDADRDHRAEILQHVVVDIGGRVAAHVEVEAGAASFDRVAGDVEVATPPPSNQMPRPQEAVPNRPVLSAGDQVVGDRRACRAGPGRS